MRKNYCKISLSVVGRQETMLQYTNNIMKLTVLIDVSGANPNAIVKSTTVAPYVK